MKKPSRQTLDSGLRKDGLVSAASFSAYPAFLCFLFCFVLGFSPRLDLCPLFTVRVFLPNISTCSLNFLFHIASVLSPWFYLRLVLDSWSVCSCSTPSVSDNKGLAWFAIFLLREWQCPSLEHIFSRTTGYFVWYCVWESALGRALVWDGSPRVSHTLLLLLLLLLVPGILVSLFSFSGLDLGKGVSSFSGLTTWQTLETSFWLTSVSYITCPCWILLHL